jgi:hypothetical protein
MFGMLDYRAYKLLWLIGLPFRIIWRLLWFVIIAVAILIGRWTEYPPLAQIVVAYVAMEAIGLILSILWGLFVIWPIHKIFFWVIDVVPSRGADKQEAEAIAANGPVIWLSVKLHSDIGNWDYDDTEEFMKTVNWRGRLFFNERENFLNRVKIMKEVYYETGKQPADLPEAELEKLIKPYKPGWLAVFVCSPQGWNSIVGAVIIVCVILYLAK